MRDMHNSYKAIVVKMPQFPGLNCSLSFHVYLYKGGTKTVPIYSAVFYTVIQFVDHFLS